MKRFLLSLFGALLILLGLSIIPSPASAATGSGIICNWTYHRTSSSGSTGQIIAACQASFDNVPLADIEAWWQPNSWSIGAWTVLDDGPYRFTVIFGPGLPSSSLAAPTQFKMRIGNVSWNMGFGQGFSDTTFTPAAADSTSPPPYPSDYFPGGVNPNTPAPPAPVAACSRTLSDPQTLVGYFKQTATPPAGVTWSYSWAFGDTTTSTQQNPTHKFTGTMPDNGWTTVLTTTATGNGTTYTASTVSASCSLRVDFYNPSVSDPASTTQDGGGDSANCPSGWGWLNPAAIVNVLICLFTPSSSSMASLNDIANGATSKAPFSWAYEIVTFPGAMMHHFAINYSAGGPDACPHLFGGEGIPGVAANQMPNDAMCQSGVLAGTSYWFLLTNGFIYAIFLVTLGFSVYYLVTWAMS